MRRILRVSVCLGLAAAGAGTARAHGVGGTRFDAPIPIDLLFLGAAATVGFTAVWLALTGRRSDQPRRIRIGTLPPGVTSALAVAARIAFLIAVAAVFYAGFFGPRVPAENVATVFVWPVWVRGLALVAIVAGSPWRLLSPWLTAYEAFSRLEGSDVALLGAYPAWLREWPALAFFVAGIGVLENLTVVPRSPRFTATVVALYAVVMLVGGVCFGREWFRNADAFDVFYRLLGRVAPLDVTVDSGGYLRVDLTPPWRGATRPVSSSVVAGFVVATVYTLTFDGFSSTPEYQALLFDARDLLGMGPEVSLLLYVAGFLAFLVAFALVVVAIGSLVEDGESRRAVAVAFAPTILPISAAYEVAHNYPYALRNVAQLATVASSHVRPSPWTPEPLWWLTLPAFWWSQVALIVGGHLVAVVAAHGVATRRYASDSAVRRTHVPMTGLMITYTVLSLWVVSRQVVV